MRPMSKPCEQRGVLQWVPTLAAAVLAACAGAQSQPPMAAPRLTAAGTTAPGVTSFVTPYPVVGEIEVLDPRLNQLIEANAQVQKLAEGFRWSEGPIWEPTQQLLLFTDVPANIIYRWTPDLGATVFMSPAGFHGQHTNSEEPGANGLALDGKGRLLMCQHGNRRVARLDDWKQPNGAQTAIASQFEGKRLNSPNDLVVHSSGAVFFTDPPYGLPKRGEPEPDKELPYSGVFRVDPKGAVTLLHSELERPNGIALSPDESVLYVANSHGPRPIWMAFDVTADANLGPGRVLFDATTLVARTGRKGGNDGMAIDEAGNIFATGPGGVLVFSPAGDHLGTILTGQPTANCKFGDDGRTLYITSNMNLLRVKTKTRGYGFR